MQTRPLSGPQPFSATSTKLIKFLASVDHFDIISYADLEREAGRPVKSGQRGYGSLCTAMRYMQREGRLFGIVHGKGVKQLTGTEAVMDVDTRRIRLGKAGRRILKRGESVNLNDVPDAEKTRHLTNMAQISAIELFSRTNTHTKLLEAANGIPQHANPSKLLEIFK